MDKQMQLAAWQAKPVPEGLPDDVKAQYLMLRQMYADFKNKTLPEAQGGRVKAKIDRFPKATRDERGMLLDFFIPRMEHDVPAVKLLSRLFYEATGGEWLYVKNTILED